MDNDRELLELAAKAAGYSIYWNWLSDESHLKQMVPYADLLADRQWNPLTDDGDAFRLAVKLGMRVSINSDATDVYDGERSHLRELHYGNEYAATRRAIVRAAAEVAKGAMSHSEFVLMFPGRFKPEEVVRAAAEIGRAKL